MKTKFLEIFQSILNELKLPEDKVIIQVPKNPDHGDFTTNYPMINSKNIGKNPMEIAEIIVNKINERNEALIEKADFVPPGFINFNINKTILSKELPLIIKSPLYTTIEVP